MPKCNNCREEAQHTQTREKSENHPDLVILYATYIYGMRWCDAACHPRYYSTLVILLTRKVCGMGLDVMGWDGLPTIHPTPFPPISPALASCQIHTYHNLTRILLQPSPAQHGSHPGVNDMKYIIPGGDSLPSMAKYSTVPRTSPTPHQTKKQNQQFCRHGTHGGVHRKPHQALQLACRGDLSFLNRRLLARFNRSRFEHQSRGRESI
jgi:hypothetical protein